MFIIFYHGSCRDGFGAAYAFWKYAQEHNIEAKFQPLYHNTEPTGLELEIDENTNVFYLDFCPNQERFKQVYEKCGHLTIIDHHASSLDQMKDLVSDWPYSEVKVSEEGSVYIIYNGKCDITFDMDHSGAILTWDILIQKKPPYFLKDIEDRDLWRFHRPHSRYVCEALNMVERDFEVWDNLDYQLLVDEGQIICKYMDTQVESLAQKFRREELSGYKVAIVNSGQWISEVCHTILVNNPDIDIAICFFIRKDRKIIYSLRSRQDSDVDVGRIANSLGGGGHKHAAGFSKDYII